MLSFFLLQPGEIVDALLYAGRGVQIHTSEAAIMLEDDMCAQIGRYRVFVAGVKRS